MQGSAEELEESGASSPPPRSSRARRDPHAQLKLLWDRSFSVEAVKELDLQGNHKDGHLNSLGARSRPARSMKGRTGKLRLEDPNCAIMDFVR